MDGENLKLTEAYSIVTNQGQ